MVGITGASGLLGWHIACAIRAAGIDEVRCASRSEFVDPDRLDRFVRGCDVVVHLAGVNRGEPILVEEANVAIARDLVAALERTGAHPVLIFANSTHRDLDTPYGRSKRGAADLFEQWSEHHDAPFVDLVLPNVFGELGRPFANSVVSTFCYQLAHGTEPTVIEDREIELIHAQDVAAGVLKCLDARRRRQEVRLDGERMTVSAVLQRLSDLSNEYRGVAIPGLPTSLDRQLFNTLRSYRFAVHPRQPVMLNEDARGAFAELVRRDGAGQVSYSLTHPGVTRGNHFHVSKMERFVVLEGTAEIRVRKLFASEVATVTVDGRQPCAVDMPTLHTHSITNTGSSLLLTLFWVDDLFDREHPDTFAEPVVL